MQPNVYAETATQDSPLVRARRVRLAHISNTVWPIHKPPWRMHFNNYYDRTNHTLYLILPIGMQQHSVSKVYAVSKHALEILEVDHKAR